MKLRWYQEKIIQDARDELKRLSQVVTHRKPRIVVRMPAGSGKTLTAAAMAKGTIEKGGSVVFLAHRDFLVEQTSETFKRLGIDHSFLAAGKWLNPWSKCHVGMVQSMKSRIGRIKPPSVCFIDESHHTPSKTWNDIVDAWPGTTFIMLTATPSFRLDGKGMDIVADSIVHGPEIRQLIDEGALSDYRYFSPTKLDTSKFHTKMKEYVTHEVDAEMSKRAIIGDIVESYKKYANNTLAVYFAPTVDTSRKYAEAFNAAGIKAEHMDANTPSNERKQIAKRLSTRETLVMCNVGLATEGYDLAAQAGADVTIETVGLCRPTQSFPLIVQMAMRAMRAKPYPGIILDHANCYNDHNWLPDDEVEWTIESKARDKKTQGIIHCKGCGAALKRGTEICVDCGTLTKASVGEFKERAGVSHIDGELAEITRQAAEAERQRLILDNKKDQGRARTLEELVELGKKRGYKNPTGWARNIFNARRRS